jgi:chitodextrinase
VRRGGRIAVAASAAALVAALAAAAPALGARPKQQAPTGVALTSVTRTSLTIAWRPVPIALYELYRGGAVAGYTFGTSFRFEGLTCGRAYRLEVDALGPFGRSDRVGIDATTSPCADSTPPTVPTGLATTEVTPASIGLSWRPSTDAGGVRGYGRYLDGTSLGDVTTTSTVFSGLACGKRYRLEVDAVDNAGNRSARAQVTSETRACPDKTPPTTPTRLVATSATGDTIGVSWTASTDNVGVTGYRLYRDGTSLGPVTATTYDFTGLACGTPHTLEVEAVDAAGNRSGRAVLQQPTAPCRVDRFVAPGGNDYRWSFVTATYDGAALSIWVDGKRESTTAVTGPINASAGALRLGAGSPLYGELFAGQLDDVRVYDRSLAEGEIQADMAAPVTAGAASGLVAAYGFDESSGTTLHDLSGNGNDGTVAGGAAWSAGHTGGALSFDGVGAEVTIPDATSLRLGVGMTLEAWVRPSELGGDWRSAIYKGDGADLDYALYAHAVESSHSSASARVWTDAEHEAHAAAPLAGSACSFLLPCSTFDRAYHAADPGQVIGAAPGDYGDQTIAADPAKASGPDVLLRPAAGGAVSARMLVLAGASHLEVQGMHFGVWEAQLDSDHITFRDVTAGRFLIDSVTNLSVIGGSYGPTLDDDNGQIRSSCPTCAAPTNVLIDGVRFHDATISAGSDAHVECLQVGDIDGLTIRASRFVNCQSHNVFISPWWKNLVKDVLLENNVGGTVVNGFFSFRIAAADTLTRCVNVVFRNNSAGGPMAIECGIVDGVKLVANVAPLQQFACDTRFTYSHDVWDGAACSLTDVNAPSGFVDVAASDLHLLPGSAAIDAGDPLDFPAKDIDGRARPVGLLPDAGAVEAG